MPSIDVRFGSYVFNSLDVDTLEIDNESRVNSVVIPRRHGFKSDDAYAAGMRIRIGGTIYNDDAQDSRSTLNSIKNALNGGKQNLRIWSDRDVECQKSYFTSRIVDGDMRVIEWECELISDEMAFKSVSETTATKTISASPQTDTFDMNGNVDTPVVIRITAGASNIATGLRIDNVSTSKYFTINQQIDAGDWVEVDTENETVVDQDGNNVIASFAQDFFKLAAGTNSIKWTGTATGSPTIKLTYQDRYDGV